MLILAFEANSALSRENETKIVKITHSVMADEYRNAEDGECDFERAQKKKFGVGLPILFMSSSFFQDEFKKEKSQLYLAISRTFHFSR